MAGYLADTYPAWIFIKREQGRVRMILSMEIQSLVSAPLGEPVTSVNFNDILVAADTEKMRATHSGM